MTQYQIIRALVHLGRGLQNGSQHPNALAWCSTQITVGRQREREREREREQGQDAEDTYRLEHIMRPHRGRPEEWRHQIWWQPPAV